VTLTHEYDMMSLTGRSAVCPWKYCLTSLLLEMMELKHVFLFI